MLSKTDFLIENFQISLLSQMWVVKETNSEISEIITKALEGCPSKQRPREGLGGFARMWCPVNLDCSCCLATAAVPPCKEEHFGSHILVPSQSCFSLLPWTPFEVAGWPFSLG